jgi:hypothetical protein
MSRIRIKTIAIGFNSEKLGCGLICCSDLSDCKFEIGTACEWCIRGIIDRIINDDKIIRSYSNFCGEFGLNRTKRRSRMNSDLKAGAAEFKGIIPLQND